MYYDMEKSGRRIRRLRALKGYSQEKLAILLNRDRSFLSAIETGKKGCSVDMLVELAGIFNVSLDYLILGKIPSSSLPDTGLESLRDEVDSLVEHLQEFRELFAAGSDPESQR